jgi:hypothetical protein
MTTFMSRLWASAIKPLEVVGGAVVGVDGVKVAHRERASDGAFLHLFADRVDRHEPENVHPQILQIIQPGGNGIEVSFLGEVSGKDFIHDRTPEPVGRRPGAQIGRICLCSRDGINYQPANESCGQWISQFFWILFMALRR